MKGPIYFEYYFMSDEILKRIVTALKANNIISFNKVCQMFPFLETYFRVLGEKTQSIPSQLDISLERI